MRRDYVNRYRRFLYEGSEPKYFVKDVISHSNSKYLDNTRHSAEKFHVYYSETGKKNRGRRLFTVVVSYANLAIYIDTTNSLTNWRDDRIPRRQRIQTVIHRVTDAAIEYGLIFYLHDEFIDFASKLDGMPLEEAITKFKSFSTRLFKKMSRIKYKKDLKFLKLYYMK